MPYVLPVWLLNHLEELDDGIGYVVRKRESIVAAVKASAKVEEGFGGFKRGHGCIYSRKPLSLPGRVRVVAVLNR